MPGAKSRSGGSRPFPALGEKLLSSEGGKAGAAGRAEGPRGRREARPEERLPPGSLAPS